METKDFKKYLEEAKFNSLLKLRKTLLNFEEQKKKTKLVEKRLRERIQEGYTIRRRKAGSGERVEVTKVYKDSPNNQRLNRVGQEYKTVVYRNSDFEEVVPRIPKRPKRRANNSQKNCWLESVAEAKAKLNAPKWVVIRKELKNPEDPAEVMGHRVYTSAMEILCAKKEQLETTA